MLLVLACPANLRQKPNCRWLLSCYVLRALIAGRTESPKVGKFFLAPDALIDYVSDVKSNFASGLRVYLTWGQTAHLTGEAVAIEDFGPKPFGNVSRKRDFRILRRRFP